MECGLRRSKIAGFSNWLRQWQQFDLACLWLANSKFIGIDLSEIHIDHANEAAKELDLKNIEFRKMDVMEMTAEDFGRFDYITAHGLFSGYLISFAKSACTL
jgi:ubiquinone/menaquinone biosynthesis C-methylase UbiE